MIVIFQGKEYKLVKKHYDMLWTDFPECYLELEGLTEHIPEYLCKYKE